MKATKRQEFDFQKEAKHFCFKFSVFGLEFFCDPDLAQAHHNSNRFMIQIGAENALGIAKGLFVFVCHYLHRLDLNQFHAFCLERAPGEGQQWGKVLWLLFFVFYS